MQLIWVQLAILCVGRVVAIPASPTIESLESIAQRLRPQLQSSSDVLTSGSKSTRETWFTLHRRALGDAPQFYAKDECDFFKSGHANPKELNWGRYDLCWHDEAEHWTQQASTRCHSCTSRENFCKNSTEKLLMHAYQPRIYNNWQGNIMFLKAYLLTQDLQRTKLIFWTDNITEFLTPDIQGFFEAFKENIELRVFDWNAQIVGTPLEKDRFFGNYEKVLIALEDFACVADLIRLLLLYNHGGVWLDSDAVLLRDIYPVTAAIGYQFYMRWANNHVMYFKARSGAARRVLESVRSMPFDEPDFENVTLKARCEPVGYNRLRANGCDVYNTCVLNTVQQAAENEKGNPDDILFDQPLGWWDPGWGGCRFDHRGDITEEMWRNYTSYYLAIHTRYPRDPDFQPDSPLRRVIDITDAWFSWCTVPDCVPPGPMRIIDYDGNVNLARQYQSLIGLEALPPLPPSAKQLQHEAEANVEHGAGFCSAESACVCNRSEPTGRPEVFPPSLQDMAGNAVGCLQQKALHGFRLVHGQGRMAYRFECCASEAEMACETGITTPWSALPTHADLHHDYSEVLTGLGVQCGPNQALQAFQLQSKALQEANGTVYRYEYACCRPKLESLAGVEPSCRNVSSGAQDHGNGAAHWLDRHIVTCQPGEQLNGFSLAAFGEPPPSTRNRHRRHGRVNYKYACCRDPQAKEE